MAAPPTDLPSVPPLTTPDLPSFGSSIAVSFVSLGLICLAAWFALRWLSRRTPGPSHGPLRVLARQALDPKRAIFVLEAGGRCFLVGASDGPMTLLAELDRDAVKRDLAARAPVTASGFVGQRFAEVLSKVLTKRDAPATTKTLTAAPPVAAGEPDISKAGAQP